MSVASQPSPVLRPGGYAELAAEIRGLGLMRRRPRFYAGLLGVNLLALASLVTGLLLLHHSWWAVLLAPAFGVVSTQIAFFGHDASHRQVARRERSSRMLGMFAGNLLNGLSYGWWLEKHNAHHAHPNDLDADPDMYAGAVVFDREQASRRRGVVGWVTGHQAWLFFPMLTLEALSLHESSVRALLRPRFRHRGVEAVLLAVHFTAYVALLATTLTWPQALVFFVGHQVVFGVYLGCSFAPGHKGMPMISPAESQDPLLRRRWAARAG